MKFRKRIQLCCVSILLLLQLYLHAQMNHDTLYLDMENLGANEGISAGFVHQITEDSYGYLWIATMQGLNRYDGYEVKEYTHMLGDSLSLPDNDVRGVFVDSRGWLWVSTFQNGLSLFDYESERFLNLGLNNLRFIKEDQWNNVWVYKENIGWYIVIIDENWKETKNFMDRKRFFQIKKEIEVFKGLPSNFAIPAILLSKKHGIWFEQNDSLFVYDLDFSSRKASLRVKRSTSSSFTNYRCRLIEDLSRDRIYYFEHDQYHQLNPLNGAPIFSTLLPKEVTRYKLLPKMIDAKGRIWLSELLLRHGFLISPTVNKISTIKKSGSEALDINWGLSGDFSFQDSHHNIWHSSTGYGVYKYDLKRERFNYYGNNHSGPVIGYLFEFTHDKIIIGDQHFISGWVLDRKDYTKTRFIKEKQLLTNLAKPYEGKTLMVNDSFVWIIVDEHEPFDTKTKRLGLWLYQCDHSRQIINSYNVLELVGGNLPPFANEFFDQQNDFYIITPDSELQIEMKIFRLKNMNEASLQSYSLPLPNESFSFGEINSPFQSNDNKIWIPTSRGGIVTFDPIEEIWEHFYHQNNNSTSLSNNNVMCFLPDPLTPDSILWVGTAGGLNKMNIKTKTFEHYTTADGLPNNVIYGILSDDRHNLWLSTNRGLCLFNPRTLETRNFTMADGLQHNEYNRRSYLKTKDGTMYFGGMGGLNSFDPNDFYNEEKPSNVVINGVRINNEKMVYSRIVPDSSDAFRLLQTMEYTNEIILSHDQRMITFEFATLDLTDPKRNQFQYQLQGFNNHWINAHSQHEATFTNLSPGNYTFKVKGANSQKKWNKENASIRLIVLPPWWGTWWFRALIFCSIASILFLGYRYRILQKEKLQTLRNRISRDLHDEIGSTLSSIAILGVVAQKEINKPKSKASNLLTRIGESTIQMMESLNDIVWAIKSNNDKIEHVLHRMRAFTSELNEATNWTIVFEYDDAILDIDLSMVHRRNIYLIFKEAVNNAIKYSKGKRLLIRFEHNRKNLLLEIKDDGIGFDQENAVSEYSLNGNGLKNMNRRADELGGTFLIHSEIGNGTSIILKCNISVLPKYH